MVTREDIMKRCGLDPEWKGPEHLAKYRERFPRGAMAGHQTGKTTRMLCDALAEAAMGRVAMVVVHHHVMRDIVQKRVDDMARQADIKPGLVRVFTLGQRDAMRGSNAPVFVDHHAAHVALCDALGYEVEERA